MAWGTLRTNTSKNLNGYRMARSDAKMQHLVLLNFFKKHASFMIFAFFRYETVCFEVNEWVAINLSNCGCIILPISTGSLEKYTKVLHSRSLKNNEKGRESERQTQEQINRS